MGKSRLKEKLGHHWGSGEVSTVWPPVLFHCLVRLVCVCAHTCVFVCVWLNRQHPVQTWECFMHRAQRDNRWAPGRLPVGERRPSDRLLCWGGMDVLKPLGPRPNVRQSVCIVRNISEVFFWNFSCVCIRVCWIVQMTHSRKEGRGQVGTKYVRRCFCFAVWVQGISCMSMTVNKCTSTHYTTQRKLRSHTRTRTAQPPTCIYEMFMVWWETLFMEQSLHSTSLQLSKASLNHCSLPF